MYLHSVPKGTLIKRPYNIADKITKITRNICAAKKEVPEKNCAKKIQNTKETTQQNYKSDVSDNKLQKCDRVFTKG